MMITRDNYETYFLLYVDNELSPAERNLLEKFVAENPDLKIELENLATASLIPEPVLFHAKQSLYRKDSLEEGLQEQLLSHLDNELHADQLSSMKAGLATNPKLAAEWELLQQVKLDASETIPCPDKNSLFRHEKSRVISISFLRIAAAAAIILAMFTAVRHYMENEQQEPVANNNRQTLPAAERNMAANVTQPTPDNIVENTATNPREKTSATIKAVNTATSTAKDQPIRHAASSGTPILATNQNRRTEVIKNIDQESNKTNPSSVTDIVHGLTQNTELIKRKQREIETGVVSNPGMKFQDIDITATDNSYAKTAALDINDDNNSDNHILFVSEERLSRTKASGLFKKVKRVLSRNANLTAGNSLKIAGFEIAAR